MTHLIVAIVGGITAWLIFKNWKYGVAFLLGHLGPDLMDFGIPGLKMGSTNPIEIMTHPWFEPLMVLGHTWWHWVIFGIVVIVALMIFRGLKKISKKTYINWILILLVFLIGIGVHLVLDALIIEKSYWI